MMSGCDVAAAMEAALQDHDGDVLIGLLEEYKKKLLTDFQIFEAAQKIVADRKTSRQSHSVEGRPYAQSLVEEVRECFTQADALRQIAYRNGGVVRVREAKRLLHESGRWSGSEDSIRATITRLLRRGSDWVPMGKGAYHLSGPWVQNGGVGLQATLDERGFVIRCDQPCCADLAQSGGGFPDH